MSRKIKLAINIGALDREKYGLTDYTLDELKEGREISVDEKTAAIFVQKGWVAATGEKVAATAPTAAEAFEESKERLETAKKRP